MEKLFCSKCKLCLPELSFTKCNCCDDFMKDVCSCGCYICSICVDLNTSKMYSGKTFEVDNEFVDGYWLTICTQCDKKLELLDKAERSKRIKQAIIKTYPLINFKKRKSSCGLC